MTRPSDLTKESNVSDNKGAAAAAKGDVQEKADKETDQGFVGTKVDPVPNEAYTLTTGPDSPSASDARRAALHAELDATKES